MTAATALVTGGSGFIGRSLVTRLVLEGWDVVCAGGRDPGVPGVRFLPVDDLVSGLPAALSGLRADVVFHLAAAGVAPDDRDGDRMFAVNVLGTAAVVRAAATVGAASLIYTGSCSEYDAGIRNAPIDERHPLAAGGLYGASKAAGGLWGRALANRLGVGFIHLRLFNVYGPGEAPHRLLPAIVGALARGERARLSPGTQFRDLLHVDDAAQGLLLAAHRAEPGVAATYDLCSGRPIRIRDFALMIAAACGAGPDRLDFGAIPMRPGELMWQVGDGAPFTQATGFTPKLSLEEGVATSVAVLRAANPVEADV